MDYFEEKGAGYQYVNLRNDAGAGKLSNFDWDHFIDFYRVYCNGPTPLTLDKFWCFT